jgi:predicted lipoprotein with Yx(FWY)xxD motif
MRLAALTLTLAALPALAAADEFTVAMHSDHGPYLVGPNGMPVYAMITDGRGGDNLAPINSCKQRCQTDWPFVEVPDGEPVAGTGVSQELLSVLESEGRGIAYYDSWALFYFAQEDGFGEPDGHGVHTYGGWWALVRPDGSAIRTGVMPGAND